MNPYKTRVEYQRRCSACNRVIEHDRCSTDCEWNWKWSKKRPVTFYRRTVTVKVGEWEETTDAE